MEFEGYIKIMKACNEEPGKIHIIAHESGLPKEDLEKPLRELEKRGIVYSDEDKRWSLTLKGSNVYTSIIKEE